MKNIGKRIIIGSDHAGFKLKKRLKLYLEKKGYFIKDVGVYSQERCDYPRFAYNVAREISSGEYNQGILICKSGIGNSIVANRFPRVRAALCYNVKAAKLSRKHNDSNILVLGASFVNGALAERILNNWLSTEFEGGRHKKRLDLIKDIEEDIRRKKI